MATILESERKDWSFIIFSSVSGFLLVGVYAFLVKAFPDKSDWPVLITFLIFAVCFDIRHLFSTYSRTYLDKIYFQDNKRWLNTSFLVILFVPLISLFILSGKEYLSFNSGAVFTFFFRVTTILGFYHLIKQNWGFMAIYKKKMNEPDDGSDKWEKLMLLSGSFIPLIMVAKLSPVWFPAEVYFIHPDINTESYVMQMWSKLTMFSLIISIVLLLAGYVIKVIPQYKYVSRNLGWFFLFTFIFMKALLARGADVLYVLLAIAIVIFIVSSVISVLKAIRFGRFNTKKWGVLISSLVLYNGILLLPIENKTVLVMAITIPHNVQYLTFVNFFNAKYYGNSTKNHGMAKTMSQKIGLFILMSFIYSILFETFRTGTRYMSFGFSNENVYLLANIIGVIFLSMVLHHYYMDAIIWRVRKDKDLSKNI